MAGAPVSYLICHAEERDAIADQHMEQMALLGV